MKLIFNDRYFKILCYIRHAVNDCLIRFSKTADDVRACAGSIDTIDRQCPEEAVDTKRRLQARDAQNDQKYRPF